MLLPNLAGAACLLLVGATLVGKLSARAALALGAVSVTAPREESGKLVFDCYKEDHLYGYGTTLGVTEELRRVSVDAP